MKLYLAQHGLALGKDEDPQRPLSETGRQEVECLARMLGAAGVRVQRVWHSGKPRALQTALCLARRVMPRGQVEELAGLGPNDPVAEFIADADVWQEDTLVVGHLPFMARLVSLLLLQDAQAELVVFQPGSVLCLERIDHDRWVLIWMLRPELCSKGSTA
ncbi:MAG TPA: phosphohistidine phosphatase SixA [Gammaproteobacteria bacterium]|nr:phosphohistidine phosphatase SixA [Gammaproteobacteria bacterium]